MFDSDLLSTYRTFVIEHHELTAGASSHATINIAGLGRIMTRNHEMKKKEYKQKHRQRSVYLSEKIRAMKREIDHRKLNVKWMENIKGDPFDAWYFDRMSKKDLLFIIDYLNENEDMRIKRSGAIEELRQRLKEYIPKKKRKEIISKILAEMK